MKKLFLIIALGVSGFTCSAQVEKLVLSPAKSVKSTNQFVLDSITRALPQPISRTLTAITSRTAGSAWDVQYNPAPESFSPTYYYVYMKSDEGRKTLVYDKDGRLVQVKQVLKNADIPEAVRNTIQAKYDGWQMVGKEERFINKDDKAVIDYKVILKKGLIRKSVLLEPDGDVKRAILTV